MDNNDYSSRGLFSTNTTLRGSKPLLRAEESLGVAPADALTVTQVIQRYSMLRETVEKLFSDLRLEIEKNPSEIARVPFEDIFVYGGQYLRPDFLPHKTAAIYLDPENFRSELKPRLDRLRETAKTQPRPSAVNYADYVSFDKTFPMTYGGTQLKHALRNACIEKQKNLAPLREDGGYDIILDGVACAVRLRGKWPTVHRADISALAELGARYDIEHRDHLQQQHGNTGLANAAACRWQALIAERSADNDRSRS